MSDFLTNLVVRSFSRTPSFQPAMASTSFSELNPEPTIMEPSPESPVVAREPPVQNTNYTNEIQIVREEIEIPGSSPNPQIIEKSVIPPAVETSEPEVILKTIETPAPAIPPTPTNTIMRTPAQPGPSKPITAQPIASPLAPRRVVTKTRKPKPPIIEQHVTEQVTENVTEQVTEQVTQHVTAQTIERPAVRRTVMIENNQEISNSFTTLVPKPTAQPLPAVNTKTRRNLPAVQPPVETEQAAVAPPPETVINVAIGRIEVRATPANATRRERQPNGPKVMTLDDYVQQRSRGAK